MKKVEYVCAKYSMCKEERSEVNEKTKRREEEEEGEEIRVSIRFRYMHIFEKD
jgi:hypothetical protein